MGVPPKGYWLFVTSTLAASRERSEPFRNFKTDEHRTRRVVKVSQLALEIANNQNGHFAQRQE
jgi:hypothetical protein